jgi:hypothetical protein
MGVDCPDGADGGVYILLPLERGRLCPVDEDGANMKGGCKPPSGSPLMRDLTNSEARFRTSTAVSLSARV